MRLKYKIAKIFGSSGDGELVSPFRLVTGLFLLAAAVRGVVALNTVVVGGDATTFLWGVRRLRSEGFPNLVVQNKPLFQLLVFWLELLFEDPVIAGKVVTVFFSSLTSVFLYFLFKDYFSQSVAVVAVVVFALHPTLIDTHASIRSDGTFTCFFIGGAFLFHRYVYARHAGKRWVYLFGSLMCSVLALATQPEGILLFLIQVVTFVVLQIGAWRSDKTDWSAYFGLVLFVGVPAGVGYYLFGKEMLEVLRHPGAYLESLHPFMAVLTGEETLNPLRKWPWYSAVFDAFLKLSYFHLSLFLALGIFATHWKARKRDRTLYLSYFGLYYLLVCVAALGSSSPDYIDVRQLMVGFLLLLPLVAGGIVLVYDWIENQLELPNTARVMLVVVIVGLLPQTLETVVIPRNSNNVGLKEAGEWIREHDEGDGPTVLSTDPEPAYYAGVDIRRVERVRNLPHDSLDGLLEKSSAEYLVFSGDATDTFRALKEVSDHPDLALIFTAQRANNAVRTVYIYRITDS